MHLKPAKGLYEELDVQNKAVLCLEWVTHPESAVRASHNWL